MKEKKKNVLVVELFLSSGGFSDWINEMKTETVTKHVQHWEARTSCKSIKWPIIDHFSFIYIEI